MSIVTERHELFLWPGEPPEMVDGAGPGVEIVGEDGVSRFSQVGIPGLFVHVPPPTGKARRAVVLCPGGAYRHLGGIPTGNGVLEPFLADDFVVGVLKYRTRPPSPQVETDALADARRAVRLMRHHAEEWGIDPRQVGMAGWSAGGNLVLNVCCHPSAGDGNATDPVERQDARPDFAALLCPWPNAKEVGDFPVPAGAPPVFIASARDDMTAPLAFAEGVAEHFRTAGAPCRHWVIDEGGHMAFSARGVGEGRQWRTHFLEWLKGLS